MFRRFLIYGFLFACFSIALTAQTPSITLTVSPNPAPLGQPVNLTASIAASGTVSFYDGSMLLGTVPILQGKATLTTSLLPAGVRQLRALYFVQPDATATSNTVSEQIQALANFGFQPSALPTSTPISHFAIGDFNGDGKPDLATIDATNSNTLAILINSGQGTFRNAGTYHYSETLSAVSVGDFNNDGKPDLAVSQSSAKAVVILLGQGDGSFKAGPTLRVALKSIDAFDGMPLVLVIGDLNGDGNADIVTANEVEKDPSQGISVLLGHGDGTFNAAVDYAGVSQPDAIVTADFNGDGRPDVAIADVLTNSVTVFLGKTAGSLQFFTTMQFTYSPTGLASADFDQDGKSDLAVAAAPLAAGGSILNILYGKGDGSFRAGPAYIAQSQCKCAAFSLGVGEFTGDNYSDLIVGGTTVPNTAFLQILDGLPGGTFHPETALTFTGPTNTGIANFVGTLVVGDFNGDGREDVAISIINSPPGEILLAESSNQLSIAATPLPDARVGVPYIATLTATGGEPPYSAWQMVSGTLPPGLSLDTSKGTISGTPALGTDGTVSFVVAVHDNAGHSTESTISLNVAPPVPAISPNGVAPIYSTSPFIQPGSWVSIYGTNLAASVASWLGDFPTTLAGTRVTIDGRPVYLSYVSPTQINLQVPDDGLLGPVPLVITNAFGATSSTIMLAPLSPSFVRFGDGSLAGVIPTPDGSGAFGSGTYDLLGAGKLSFPTRPVRPGEVLSLYGTGFGDTIPHVPAGTNPSTPAPFAGTMKISIGGVQAQISFAGIVSAGLFQFNVTIPPLPAGNQPLFVVITTATSAVSLGGYSIPIQQAQQ